MQTPILTLNIGKPVSFRGDGEHSAIAKSPVDSPVFLGRTGITGDQVADTVHHGGPDKALHHYPYDHYDYWRGRLPGHAFLKKPGAFGENISTTGIIESEARIGDRFRLGAALIEISHGRQPCWKLDHRFGVKGKNSVMADIVRTGKCGFYYRVIEEGMVAPDAVMKRVERGLAEWTVECVFMLLIGGRGKKDPAALRQLQDMELLATNWRERAARILDNPG
ncbi:MOSC domain-containing protein [Sphingorhabdus sp. Alg239-R122]|uniref:MOSC domain-containing protein n=1 Tax=Sphingorhabdus sp. Alg239-R122 TaxID=2305989 RepID=UPI0013DD3D49|nr:MOSC domain-containing protein [Sphingorhabdus sp. Alg239-R122]